MADIGIISWPDKRVDYFSSRGNARSEKIGFLHLETTKILFVESPIFLKIMSEADKENF